MQVPDEQVVRIISDHSRKLERLESIGTVAGGAVGGAHHTLCAFQPTIAVATFGRVRLLPGTGLRYRVISWAIMLDKAGSAVVDLLKSSGYPPSTSMCPAARPNTFGASHKTGGTTGWASTTFNHGDYLILNVFSFAVAAQLAFSLELKVEQQ